MTLPAAPCDRCPEPTLQGARAAGPLGPPSMRLRDARGPLAAHQPCAALCAPTGRPAPAPAPLALITVMPWAAGLSDVPAAAAVRARRDGHYARALAWRAPGCAASGLSEFRQRLMPGHAALWRLEPRLTLLRTQGFLKAHGRHRTAAPSVRAALQPRNRLEGVGATLRHALHGLATAAPAWLPSWDPAAWCDRSSQRVAAERLPPERPARSARAEPIGRDGHQGLRALYEPAAPAWLRERPTIELLRQGRLQQGDASPQDQPVRGRSAEDWPPAPGLISSP